MTKKEIKEKIKKLYVTSDVSDVKVITDKRYIEIYVLCKLSGAYSFTHYRYYQHKLLSVKGNVMFLDIIAMSNLFN